MKFTHKEGKMSIIIENLTESELGSEVVLLIEQLVNETLTHRGCPFDAEISVTIVDNKQIREMNRDYREIDAVTDVLSFPLIEFEVPGQFDPIIEDSAEDYFNLDTGELMLGDIVLSMEKAITQADEYGHSVPREIGFLLVHSMLHLLGFDHMEEEEEVIMNQLQEEILTKAGLNR